MNRRIVRIVLAVLIAPLAFLPVILAFLSMVQISSRGWNITLPGLFFLSSMPLLLIAYSATLVLGLPAYLLLSHYQKGSYLVHAAVRTLVALVIGLLKFELPLRPVDVVLAVHIAVSGAAIAITFRAIAGMPDAYDATP